MHAAVPGSALDWIELASGDIIDWSRASGGRRHRPGPSASIHAAIADVIVGALVSPPCLVAFSGGRDSSGILAVAVDEARRRGLAAPIPITLRFQDAPDADETDWQELVVRHLGLDDWIRVPIAGELSVLGPYAQRVLRAHGVMHPSNAYAMAPMLERAARGSLLTGVYGDQLLQGWRWRALAAARATGRTRLRPRTVVLGAAAAMPVRLRYEYEWLRLGDSRGRAVPWMRPAAIDEYRRRLARARASESRRFAGWADAFAARHQARLTRRAYEVVGEMFGARVVNPFADDAVARALAASAPRDGPGSRTAAMGTMFGSLLPERVIARKSKASFPLLDDRVDELATRWDGTGLPAHLIDAALLRQDGRRDYRASYLWQLIWLRACGTD
jgi:asparagine synthetase B (glutamine-hydrolysing)